MCSLQISLIMHYMIQTIYCCLGGFCLFVLLIDWIVVDWHKMETMSIKSIWTLEIIENACLT